MAPSLISRLFPGPSTCPSQPRTRSFSWSNTALIYLPLSSFRPGSFYQSFVGVLPLSPSSGFGGLLVLGPRPSFPHGQLCHTPFVFLVESHRCRNPLLGGRPFEDQVRSFPSLLVAVSSSLPGLISASMGHVESTISTIRKAVCLQLFIRIFKGQSLSLGPRFPPASFRFSPLQFPSGFPVRIYWFSSPRRSAPSL